MSTMPADAEVVRDVSGAVRRQAAQRQRDRDLLVLSILVVLATFALRVDDSRVRLNFWPGVLLPESCPTRIWADLNCPGCGLTRSLIRLSRGEMSASLRENRVGWFMALAVLFQIPFRLISLRTNGRIMSSAVRSALGWTLVIVLIGNWFCGFFV